MDRRQQRTRPHAVARRRVVYEGKHILHVGKTFDGPVERTIDAGDKLVCAGFIDTHVHSGHRASHRLITDTGRPMYYGQPFLEISVPKEGKPVSGDPRYLKHGDAGAQRRASSSMQPSPSPSCFATA